MMILSVMNLLVESNRKSNPECGEIIGLCN